MWEPKRRGIILESKQGREEPSAVTNLTQELEAKEGAGKIDSEATESTRNLLYERRSWRYITEEPEASAGREKASSCQPVSFPTRSREHDTSGLDHHEICGTNTERASRVARGGRSIRSTTRARTRSRRTRSTRRGL